MPDLPVVGDAPSKAAGGAGAFITKRIGPLPLWSWVAAGALALFALRFLGGGRAGVSGGAASSSVRPGPGYGPGAAPATGPGTGANLGPPSITAPPPTIVPAPIVTMPITRPQPGPGIGPIIGPEFDWPVLPITRPQPGPGIGPINGPVFDWPVLPITPPQTPIAINPGSGVGATPSLGYTMPGVSIPQAGLIGFTPTTGPYANQPGLTDPNTGAFFPGSQFPSLYPAAAAPSASFVPDHPIGLGGGTRTAGGGFERNIDPADLAP